jgi:hypothetical protein
MHRTVALILCCLWLTGCLDHPRTAVQATYAPIPPPLAAFQPDSESPVLKPLFDNEDSAFRDLVKAACALGAFGDPLPDRVLRRWEPIDTYYDRANVVIVLHRDAQEERGYYIVPPFSSFLPPSHDGTWTWQPLRLSPVYEPGWSWAPLKFSDSHGFYSDRLYEYRRTR